MNPSGIAPTEFKVLIKPEKIADRTAGGVWKPQDLREKEQAAATQGEIIAISPLAFTYADWPVTTSPPKVGDRVAFARYAGMTVKGSDGEEYRLVNDRDIAGIYVQC